MKAKRSRSPNGTRKQEKLYPIRNVSESTKALMSIFAAERNQTVGEFLSFLVDEYRSSREVKPKSDSDLGLLSFMSRNELSSPASRDEGNDPDRS